VRGARCSSCSSVRFSASSCCRGCGRSWTPFRADDGAGAEPPRLRHVRDELRES
jgi:hypothetical protein